MTGSDNGVVDSQTETMTMPPKPIYANLGNHGPAERLDLVDPDNRRTVIRMLAEIPSPAEYRNNAFEDKVDLNTVRAVILCHRHVETGLWQLRIDGLAKPEFPVWRTKDHIHKDGYWLICDPKVVYRHWSGDYGGLECLDAPYSNKTLPDGSSRLVAKTIAHFASQIFGENKIEGWAMPEGKSKQYSRLTATAPLPDHLRDLDPFH